MLFHILMHFKQNCIVSDLNPDLILTYVMVRDNVDDLVASLKVHAREYVKDPASYYYYVREENPTSPLEKASRLIFLNRTCFNGLYRVNKSGKFNVPFGKYKNPNIVNEENLHATSRILQSARTDVSCRDFSEILDIVSENDFVYLDPPYHPTSSTANFTSYMNREFGYEDLKRLVEFCLHLDSKGAKVMMSNSDTDVVSGLFPKQWNQQRIAANRFINSDSDKRTGHHELLITNY